MEKPCFVYILTNRSRSSLYVGFTNNLRARLTNHRQGFSVFTSSYRIYRLVYFEAHQEVRIARYREQKLKRWRRAWKDDLIASVNPDWRDLSGEIPFD